MQKSKSCKYSNTGKLKQVLTKREEEMVTTFRAIYVKHRSDIK